MIRLLYIICALSILTLHGCGGSSSGSNASKGVDVGGGQVSQVPPA